MNVSGTAAQAWPPPDSCVTVGSGQGRRCGASCLRCTRSTHGAAPTPPRCTAHPSPRYAPANDILCKWMIHIIRMETKPIVDKRFDAHQLDDLDHRIPTLVLICTRETARLFFSWTLLARVLTRKSVSVPLCAAVPAVLRHRAVAAARAHHHRPAHRRLRLQALAALLAHRGTRLVSTRPPLLCLGLQIAFE